MKIAIIKLIEQLIETVSSQHFYALIS